ncbi:MAG TPA: SDR family oxidoreductase, partial [Firmicutes bacterium]|nr:SDR family oxidoreductase [Bacillota bacterium]
DINLEGAKAVVQEIEAKGGTAIAVKTDITSQADVENLVDTAVETFGTVDVLVNNAGIMDNMEPAGDITDSKWEQVFAVNITGVMRTTRKVIPIFLKRKKGVIGNIASAGGLQGCRAGAIYTSSKFAVVGFTRNTGFMYADEGIRCNAIAPGAVETNIGTTMTNINMFGASRQNLSMAANPRTGKPEEIARIALFLASDDSSFINGAVIVADAGWTAC